jgi:DNA-binding transcriptional MerR regulator
MGTKYKIGDIANYFHLSRQTIRFYENKGLLTSHQDENNGYRYYGYAEINLISDVIQLKQYGFSLDQITELSQRADINDFDQQFEKQEKLIQKEIEEKQQALLRMSQMRTNLQLIRKKINQENFEISPSLVFQEFNNYGKDSGLRDSNETLNLLECSSPSPIGFKAKLNSDETVDHFLWGFCLPYNLVKKEQSMVPIKNEQLFPKNTIHLIFDAGKEGELSQKIQQNLINLHQKHQFVVCGDIFGRILLRAHENHSVEDQKRFFEMWIPIRDIDYYQH